MRQYFVVLLFSAFFYTVCNEAENICESDVCAQICNPVGDSYKCDCMKGYTLMADGISCKPQKRALKKGGRCENNNPCDQDCIDTGTAIKCSCREGYELAKDERTCKDIDECALQLHDCKANEECENEIGTYACYEPFFGENDINFDEKCPPGYKFNIENEVCDDIDECIFELMCVPPKTCKNTIGSFFCEEPTPKCPPGFFLKPETGVCDDINECEQAQNCKEDEDCLNEPGGYKCLPKTTTQRTTTTTTTTTKPSPRPTTRKPVSCPQGYSYVEWTKDCEDINECQSGAHKCDVLERCDNTIGSYHCSRIYGCGTGYTLNLANGLCEDDDECLLGTHNCKQLGTNFRCKNTLGSYRCEAVRETPSRYRPVAAVPNLSPARTYPTVPTNPSTPSSTPSSTTSTIYSTTSSESTTTTATTYRNYSRTSVYEPPFISSKAYTTSLSSTTPKISTTPKSSRSYTITFLPPPITPAVIPYIPQRLPTTSETPHRGFSMHHSNIPLIIPYFPQRGRTTPAEPYREFATPFYHHVIGGQLKKCLPGYKINIRGECEDIDECQSNPCGKNEKCLNFNGRYECAAPMQCRKGYELNEAGDQCIDIDECTRNVHKCHSTQICKNYQGFYTCDCPPGHQLRMNQCLDIDECKLFRPCGSYADCINTKGSFSCECKAGFRTNGAACEEIDECSESADLCDQKCVNIWGSYRCSCNLGFTLNSDNRTCTDIDECERFKDKRLCIGTCKNIPGSYTCECPKGYHLGSDGRICKDIDECEQNVCLHDEVCLNLKGSFRCYSIKCPENYIKDPSHKTRCKRLQHVCDPRDYNCLSQPGQFTYQYIAMVSNLPLPSGPLQIFEIKGPKLDSARAEYSVKLLDVICPFGVKKVDDSYFHKVTDQINSISVFLVKSIQGPQEVKIQIHIRFFNGNIMIGNTVVYVIIVVSEYTF